MKTRTLLLIAALVSGLSVAQAEPVNATPSPTPELTTYQSLRASLAAIKTPEALWAWERDTLVPQRGELSENELGNLINALAISYRDVGNVAGGNAAATLALVPKYIPDWETSSHPVVHNYYNYLDVYPAYGALRASVAAAASKEELANVVSEYFATNLYPEQFENLDSRRFALYNVSTVIATAATRLGAPDAINWALTGYCGATMTNQAQIDLTIGQVAAALKAKDFNLGRANAWIEGQNSGQPAVEFTAEELTLPAVLADIPAIASTFDTTATMAAAKEQYRAAKNSAQVDRAIYAVANVLKSHDLNLARANAWIEAQKAGESFDLTLDAK